MIEVKNIWNSSLISLNLSVVLKCLDKIVSVYISMIIQSSAICQNHDLMRHDYMTFSRLWSSRQLWLKIFPNTWTFNHDDNQIWSSHRLTHVKKKKVAQSNPISNVNKSFSRTVSKFRIERYSIVHQRRWKDSFGNFVVVFSLRNVKQKVQHEKLVFF